MKRLRAKLDQSKADYCNLAGQLLTHRRDLAKLDAEIEVAQQLKGVAGYLGRRGSDLLEIRAAPQRSGLR